MKNKWNLIPLVFVALGVLIIYSSMSVSRTRNANIQAEIHEISMANTVYNEIQLCIISVGPAVRTPAHVKACYDDIIKKHDAHNIPRYGDGIK